MSIVNQMLKDLDARCGPASSSQVAALHGMGLLTSGRNKTGYGRIFLLSSGAALLLVIAGYQAMTWFQGDQATPTIELHQVSPVIGSPRAAAEAQTLPLTEPPISAPVELSSLTTRIADAHEAVEQVQIKVPATASPARAAPAPAAVPEPAKIAPIKKISPQQKADRLFADAQQALVNRDYERGELSLRQLLSEFPRHHAARAQLAALLVAAQSAGAAEQLLAEGLQDAGQEVALAKPYAQLLIAGDKPEAARAVLDTAIAGGRADAEAYALRAAILHQLEQHVEAAQDYRQALRRAPENAIWWVGLAVAEEHAQRLQQALAAYRQAQGLPMETAVQKYVNQRVGLIETMGER
ncbi:MAG: hypothetical protein RQ736_05635 [Thiogranum sp.]|nr:hypothetical protein [Thiogranum sp.]